MPKFATITSRIRNLWLILERKLLDGSGELETTKSSSMHQLYGVKNWIVLLISPWSLTPPPLTLSRAFSDSPFSVSQTFLSFNCWCSYFLFTQSLSPSHTHPHTLSLFNSFTHTLIKIFPTRLMLAVDYVRVANFKKLLLDRFRISWTILNWRWWCKLLLIRCNNYLH